MSLRLSMLKGPKGIALSKTEHIFSQQGGTLGRAETNSWPLLDPDKFLSSCHCEISFNNDEAFLLDRSTNGTFINESIEPIGRGNTISLADNDVIDLGDYQFLVKLDVNNFISTNPANSPFEVSSSDINSAKFSNENSLEGFSSSQPASYFSQEMDPLALWDKHNHTNQNNFSKQDKEFLFKQTIPEPLVDTSNSLDNYLRLSVPASPYDNLSSIDPGPSINQAITWPTISQENVIPENWDDDLLRSESPKKSFQDEPKQQSFNNIDDELKSEKTNNFITECVETIAVIKPADTLDCKKINQARTEIVDKSHIDESEKLTNTKNSPLIDALGLDKSRLNVEDIAEIEELSGYILREVVDGLLSVLRSRSSIKNEFRMNVTTIQPIENNPLKFSVNVDDALENIFLKKTNAFKKPTQAFREGFQEISEHQLAMIAGIREGFEAMLSHFDPSELEIMFNKNPKKGLIPLIHKTKHWNNYLDYYSKLSEDIDLSFQQLFGSQFSAAYENQLKRVSNLTKKEI